MIAPRQQYEAEQMERWAEEQMGLIATRITNKTASTEDLNELERLIKVWKENEAIRVAATP